jgi:hypothetical protein
MPDLGTGRAGGAAVAGVARRRLSWSVPAGDIGGGAAGALAAVAVVCGRWGACEAPRSWWCTCCAVGRLVGFLARQR